MYRLSGQGDVMINNWRLECFICVAQTLNFHQAADALHVSQPALTKQISMLEEDLGVRLFDRDTMHVRLTNECHAFLGKAILTLQDMRNLEGMFQHNRHIVFNYLYRYGLYEVGTRFHERRPNTALNMLRLKIWGDTPSVIRRPGNVVIGREDVIGMQANSVFVPLKRARYYMIIAKDDPLAKRSIVSVNDVDLDHVIIRSGSQVSMRDIDDPGIRLEDLLGNRRFIGCDTLDETIEVVRSGCGTAFTLMPLDMDPNLVARVPLDIFAPVTIGVGYLKQNETDDLRELVRILLEVYRDGDDVTGDGAGDDSTSGDAGDGGAGGFRYASARIKPIPKGGLPPVFA